MKKEVDLKLFLLYLKQLGLVELGTEGSHTKYNFTDNPLTRPIIVRKNYKTIPIHHIHTNLQTLNKTKKEFEVFLALQNKKGTK